MRVNSCMLQARMFFSAARPSARPMLSLTRPSAPLFALQYGGFGRKQGMFVPSCSFFSVRPDPSLEADEAEIVNQQSSATPFDDDYFAADSKYALFSIDPF